MSNSEESAIKREASGGTVSAPMFRGYNELAVHVADPSTASRFYTDVLGCSLVRSEEDCVEVTNGALRLFLLRDPSQAHDLVVPSFDVPDREAALVHLKASGCRFVAIGPHAPGGVYARDTFGVVFDVIERPSTAGDMKA